MIKLKAGLLLLALLFSLMLQAAVRPAHIFDSNMVLQREKPVRIWGMADPSEKVKVEFEGQVKSTETNEQGEWSLYLDPMPVNTRPGEMKISGKSGTVLFTNVLVGDVWVLGGQSNMEFDLARIFHGDVEILSANFPQIRLMTIPSSANRVSQKDFDRINEYDGWYDRFDKKGYWFICSPTTVPTFSGLGYIFGRRLYMASQVPIGLIDASLGGTTVEAWLSPETLARMPENSALLKQWNDRVATYDPEQDLKERIKNWEIRSAARIKEGLEPNPKPTEPSPNPRYDRNYPGSSYTGMVKPIAGLTVKGAVFHQGYNNALEDARPKLYALNFKALIDDWRETFHDRDLPFGIIEFSAGGEPQTLENFELRMLDPSPNIREGQLKAFRDKQNTGFVCSYDQQVNWYHPQKKVEAGERMARWALATQYGFQLKWEPPMVQRIERMKDKIIVTFDREVKSSDDRPLQGFSIAGSDRHFFPGKASYVKIPNEKGQATDDKKRIEVSNDLCADPVEVRYAWARNPLGNLVSVECPLIPVPLFRSDDWPYPEAPYLPDEYAAHRALMKNLRQQAEEQARARIIREAEKLLNDNRKKKLPDEPADPDQQVGALWQKSGPGLHSGFGSVDVAYSKSIPPQGEITTSVQLRGWKGERINCQLLAWSATGQDTIRVKAGGFRNGKDSIGRERVTVSVVRYVLTGEFNGCGPQDLKKGPVHLSPDPLARSTGFPLSARENRPVWISIDIPSNLPAGMYKGNISLISASGVLSNHPISIEVLNKALPAPADWSFHLDLWQHPDAVARYSGVQCWSPEHLQLLRSMLTMLARAGQKCITTTIVDEPWNHQTFDDFGSMVKWTRKSNGKWTFDYSVFDRYVSLAMECGIKEQINCFSMVPVSNKFTWFDEETSKMVVKETSPGTELYKDIWKGFLTDFREHLRQKGWLAITTLALDEREEKEMTDLFSFLKETAPEFKISMAGFYYKAINASIYDFCVNWRHTGKIAGEVLKARKNAGLKTTYYVACGIPKPNNFTFSPPAESCYEGWFAAAMGFDGFLRWAYNSWPGNPFVDSRYTKWPAGDSYLVYPYALSSVRFERLREGIQDYEKIRILRKELAADRSPEAAAALKRLNDFLASIDEKSLEKKSASGIIREGKALLNEIVKSMYPAKQVVATWRPDAAEPALVRGGYPVESNDVPKFHRNE